MDSQRSALVPSTLLLSNPTKFTVSSITLSDSISSPILSLTVDRKSSDISITFPNQDLVEYTPDPEFINRQRKTESSTTTSSSSSSSSPSPSPSPLSTTATSTSSNNKELPVLLLKVHARSGLKLSFELTGDLLDSVRPKSRARTGTESSGERNYDLENKNKQKPQSQNEILSIGINNKEGDASSFHNTSNNNNYNYNNNTVTGNENERNAAAAVAVAFDSLPSRSNEVTRTIAGPCATTPEDISTGRYSPTIYFAETQTTQGMHDLCSEDSFQQQLLENPGSVTTVEIEYNLQTQTYSWEWDYSTEDRSEQRSQSHKAVFGFLTRSHLTGALEVLAMFSVWIQYGSSNSGPRLPSTTIQSTSPWNARHWRRTSTPEKNSNLTRMPSLWNKMPAIPALPTSHGSLPTLHQETSRQDDEKISFDNADAFIPIRVSSPLPLANGTEDGPLFRATVVECEQHIRSMKNASKRILKAAQSALEARKAWVAAEELLVKEMDLLKPSESLVDQYWRPISEHLSEQTEKLSQHMRDSIIEPFSRFYGIDIKTAELHRKTFDEESKEYYSYLSRYMGMKQDNNQKKQEADSKYERKRRAFELRRLEYWNFLTTMKLGGSKGDELNHQLIKYAQNHCQHVSEMGTIANELNSNLNTMATASKLRQEKFAEQHNTSITSSANLSTTTLLPPTRPFARNNGGLVLGLGQAKAVSPPSIASLDSPKTPAFERDSFDLQFEPEVVIPSLVYGTTQISNASSSSITGIRDLEHQDIDAGLAMGRRKEGFLFATSRPSAHSGTVLEKPNINWHKYWCVLSEGQLHEYSNWRKGVTQPHIEPINLRIATVRACRNQDRRFCFEVITPRFRRVYQAMNSDDMNSWINVISNAIQGLLNGTSSCRNLNLEYMNGIGNKAPGSPDGKGLMAGLGMSRPSMEQVLNATSLPLSLQDRVLPGQAFGRKRGGTAVDGLNELGQILQPLSAQINQSNDTQGDSNQLGVKLLLTMREQHLANTVCADCGAKNPDWCVINMGILVCIECSGIHRSLGTHISKVRSFNLDTTTYTKDLCEFIRSVGNNISNEVWEANLVQPKDQQQQQQQQQPPPPNNQEQQSKKVAFRKPVVNDSREYKVTFIRKKYVDRAFVYRQQFTGPGDITANATDALFRAVCANDIPAAIAAFAAGANINAVQKAENENDAGPFVEQGQAPSHPSKKDSEDTFGLGDIPNTLISPILDDSALHQSLLDESAVSETSSQLSRTTIGSNSVSATDRSEDVNSLDQKTIGSLEIRPRPGGGRPISSVMVLQTTPLLIALRNGVPFTLEDGFDVYPLAEYLMQNGAASNMSMEVKLLNNDQGTTLIEPSGPIHVRRGIRVKSEELSENIIERDSPLQMSSSIGSRLSAGTTSTSLAPTSPSRGSIRSSNSTDTEIVDKTANRRSVGQIIELRGEDGASAMEYLRAKSIARGEAPITSSGLSPSTPTSSTTVTAAPEYQPSQDNTRLRPSSLKDMNIASMSTPSMSSALINKLTLSPRLRPSGSVMSPSDSTTHSPNIPSTLGNGHRDSRAMSASPIASYPPPTRYNNQDIATLFQNQKRRGSDGGNGSGIFSSMKGSTFSIKDKEKAAAKAQARRSGDFSMFRPPSILSSLSQQTDTNAITPPPSMEIGSYYFTEGHQLMNDNSKGLGAFPQEISNTSNSSMATPTRTQKVKASLTKSIRLSALYLRGTVLKDDNKTRSAASITKGGAQSRSSSSVARLDSDEEGDNDDEEEGEDEDEDEGELTVAELIALEDQQLQQQQDQPVSSPQPVPSTASIPTSRFSSRSFFASMSFSSSPNLTQKQQQQSSTLSS